MYQHMMAPGRIPSRNKALMGKCNYASIAHKPKRDEPERKEAPVKRNFAMQDPSKDEPQRKETPVKRNFAMQSLFKEKSGRQIGASKKREELLKADKDGERNQPFMTQRKLKGTDPDYSGFRHFPVIEIQAD